LQPFFEADCAAQADLIRSCIQLSWSTQDENLTFTLERSVGDDADYSLLTTISGGSSNTYADTDVTLGETYYYRLTAANSSAVTCEPVEIECSFRDPEAPVLSQLDVDPDTHAPLGSALEGN